MFSALFLSSFAVCFLMPNLISVNFGLTLLSWMKSFSPEVCQAILLADRRSIGWRSGHGNAIAQAYEQMIMPLVSEPDKRSQVVWGMPDFESRFGRFPEGMRLAKTAVDLETLEILAKEGIIFTILVPHQAGKVRKLGGTAWRNVRGANIDPSMSSLPVKLRGPDTAMFLPMKLSCRTLQVMFQY